MNACKSWLIGLFGFSTYLTGYSLPRIEFGSAMGAGTGEYNKKFVRDKYNNKCIDVLRELFNKNYTMPIRRPAYQTIPRHIHQIWVGGSSVPSKFNKLIDSWKKKHPDWKHTLWLDRDVARLNLRNRVVYDITSDPIEKANIARYEILEKFGGMYVDIDFLCLKSFEPFHKRYDFYVGIAPLDCTAILNNALIACGPHHPIIKHCIDTIPKDFSKENRFERTGVRHFSRSFFAQVNQTPGTVIAMPPGFFYPLGKSDEKKYDEKTMKKETFAVHYWASTHVAPKARNKAHH